MSTQQQIEMILARQLAGYLAAPILIVDETGTIVFYNEPAERVLGRQFDEGPISPAAWTSVFELTQESGAPLPVEDLPVITALRRCRPAYRAFWMRGLDGVRRHLTATGLPLVLEDGRCVGSIGLFWQVGELPAPAEIRVGGLDLVPAGVLSEPGQQREMP